MRSWNELFEGKSESRVENGVRVKEKRERKSRNRMKKKENSYRKK